MIISPIPSAVTPATNPQGTTPPSRVEAMRSLRMKTMSTPLENQPQIPILDDNETQAPAEATQPLSPQLAHLAKQRRALQVKEREIADREKALQSNSGNSIDVAKLKSDPLRVMLENGVTYDQLTEAIMNSQGQDNSEIHALKAEIESLKQGIDQKFTDKDAQTEQAVLAEMTREAEVIVRSNDDFELIREMKQIPNVTKLIERTYRQTGEVLDVREALQLVEDELLKDAQRITGFKKIQSRMIPQFQPQQRQTGMRTLTNRDTASVPLSAKARAMAAFYGTIPKR